MGQESRRANILTPLVTHPGAMYEDREQRPAYHLISYFFCVDRHHSIKSRACLIPSRGIHLPLVKQGALLCGDRSLVESPVLRAAFCLAFNLFQGCMPCHDYSAQ